MHKYVVVVLLFVRNCPEGRWYCRRVSCSYGTLEEEVYRERYSEHVRSKSGNPGPSQFLDTIAIHLHTRSGAVGKVLKEHLL
jgi:hypothetical protein